MNSEDFNEEVDADVAEQAFNDAQAILQAKQGIHKEQEEQMDTGKK